MALSNMKAAEKAAEDAEAAEKSIRI